MEQCQDLKCLPKCIVEGGNLVLEELLMNGGLHVLWK